MYICEKCYKTFTEFGQKIQHDGIMTVIYKACPHCGSVHYSDNIKKINTIERVRELIEKRGL